MPSLVYLELSGANLSRIPTESLRAPSLRTLRLQNVDLDTVDFNALATAYPALVELDLHHRSPQGPLALRHSRAPNSTLTVLSLASSTCAWGSGMAWAGLPVRYLRLYCPNASAVTASMFPDQRSLQAIVIDAPNASTVAIDAISDAFFFDALRFNVLFNNLQPLNLSADHGRITCSLSVLQRDYRVLCNCGNGLVKASYCPELHPLACPEEQGVFIWPPQLCDGRRDCTSGADELFCAGQILLHASTIRSGEATPAGDALCMTQLAVSIRNGQFHVPTKAFHVVVCFPLYGVFTSWYAGEANFGESTFRSVVAFGGEREEAEARGRAGKGVRSGGDGGDRDGPCGHQHIPSLALRVCSWFFEPSAATLHTLAYFRRVSQETVVKSSTYRIISGSLLGVTPGGEVANITPEDEFLPRFKAAERLPLVLPAVPTTTSPPQSSSQKKRDSNTAVVAVSVGLATVLLAACAVLLHRRRQRPNTADALASALGEAQAGFQAKFPKLRCEPLRAIPWYNRHTQAGPCPG
jgi:hypothetical protein